MINNNDGFSLIISTRFSSGALKFCLENLRKHSRLEHEYIIVCDVFASWQTYKYLQENEIFYYQANLCNWYALMNYGAKQATKEYLAFFQDDLIVSKDWDINIKKYLNHSILITPKYLQGFEIGNYFGFDSELKNLTTGDFKIDEFNRYCKEHAREGISEDCWGYFPEIIAKDTFEKLGGYTTFTREEDVHVHHEDGLKYRLRQIGGDYFHANDSFAYHFPNICRDKIPLYGWIINQGQAHYPLICKKCGVKYIGADLSYEETNSALYLGYYICARCR